MKLIAFILLLNPLVSFTQRDSTHIRDKFYLELNAGYGKMTYKQKYYANTGVIDYYELEDRSLNFSASLYFRNKWILTGITGQLITFESDMVRYLSYNLSFNILNLLNKNRFSHSFFGPWFSYGYANYASSVFPRYALGINYQFKHIHVALKHDWFKRKPNAISFIDAKNIYLEVGYAFNLESFRKKK